MGLMAVITWIDPAAGDKPPPYGSHRGSSHAGTAIRTAAPAVVAVALLSSRVDVHDPWLPEFGEEIVVEGH